MSTRAAMTEAERDAREELVALAESMLNGTLSFFEGAARVNAIRVRVGGILERDEDFDAFVVVDSESDYLPLEHAKPLWAAEALAGLAAEYERTEQWAAGFAPEACRNLILRFGKSSSLTSPPAHEI